MQTKFKMFRKWKKDWKELIPSKNRLRNKKKLWKRLPNKNNRLKIRLIFLKKYLKNRQLSLKHQNYQPKEGMITKLRRNKSLKFHQRKNQIYRNIQLPNQKPNLLLQKKKSLKLMHLSQQWSKIFQLTRENKKMMDLRKKSKCRNSNKNQKLKLLKLKIQSLNKNRFLNKSF